jgi:hypothetical protein
MVCPIEEEVEGESLEGFKRATREKCPLSFAKRVVLCVGGCGGWPVLVLRDFFPVARAVRFYAGVEIVQAQRGKAAVGHLSNKNSKPCWSRGSVGPRLTKRRKTRDSSTVSLTRTSTLSLLVVVLSATHPPPHPLAIAPRL